jgi:AAA ATPase domain
MPKFNPFRPNSIVTMGMFAGRWDELVAIEQALFQTKNGNPRNFAVLGERGIGKSSLLMAANLNAGGDVEVTDGTSFNFLVIQAELVFATSFDDLVAIISAEFKAEAGRRQAVKTFAVKAFDFITNWKVMGIEYKKDGTKAPDILLIDSLAEGIGNFLRDVGNDLDGLLIMIDEADKPSEEARLGEFLKLLTEKLTRLGCHRVCVGLAGLPDLVSKLRSSHESSPRIFEILNLPALKPEDAKRVIRRGLQEAAEKNKFETAIAPEALDLIVDLSEGYPHFIQQFAYSAFAQDDDDNISVEDVARGAYDANGALDQLGHRYFSELYYDKIGSEDYRRVLNAMSEHSDRWVSRGTILATSGVKNTQVTNALKALRERNIIQVNPEKQGEYKLPTRSFAVWIRALTAKKAAQATVAAPTEVGKRGNAR